MNENAFLYIFYYYGELLLLFDACEGVLFMHLVWLNWCAS